MLRAGVFCWGAESQLRVEFRLVEVGCAVKSPVREALLPPRPSFIFARFPTYRKFQTARDP